MTNPLLKPYVFLNKRTMVNANEVTFLEADVNYTKVYFEERAPLMVAVTLKKIQPLLEVHGFVRIHKKFLINLNYADQLLLPKEEMTALSQSLVKVSRRKKSTLKRNLKSKKTDARMYQINS